MTMQDERREEYTRGVAAERRRCEKIARAKANSPARTLHGSFANAVALEIADEICGKKNTEIPPSLEAVHGF